MGRRGLSRAHRDRSCVLDHGACRGPKAVTNSLESLFHKEGTDIPFAPVLYGACRGPKALCVLLYSPNPPKADVSGGMGDKGLRTLKCNTFNTSRKCWVCTIGILVFHRAGCQSPFSENLPGAIGLSAFAN